LLLWSRSRLNCALYINLHGSSLLAKRIMRSVKLLVGNFLYIESDSQRNGSRIRLNSPSLTASGTTERTCLQFFYYMYGEDVGTLNVYFNGEVAWTQSGNTLK